MDDARRILRASPRPDRAAFPAALVAAGKRKREKDGSTEVQRRQSKVEKRWKESAHCGADSNTNLAIAEAEMGRVVPVAAYAPLGYVDEEEKQWLEEGEER